MGLRPSSGFVTAKLVGTVEVTPLSPPSAPTNRPPSGGPCDEPEEEHQGNVINITATRRYDCYYRYTDGFGRTQRHTKKGQKYCYLTVLVQVDCPPDYYFSPDSGRCNKNVTPPPDIPPLPSSPPEPEEDEPVKPGCENYGKSPDSMGMVTFLGSQPPKPGESRYQDYLNLNTFETDGKGGLRVKYQANHNLLHRLIKKGIKIHEQVHIDQLYRNAEQKVIDIVKNPNVPAGMLFYIPNKVDSYLYEIEAYSAELKYWNRLLKRTDLSTQLRTAIEVSKQQAIDKINENQNNADKACK